ncbi:hypothetical protein DK28_0214895 [Peptococcaceae bacterium SCADC1_2_3]|jgi:hypothetical protein|nr:hypothetical protein DK28_0214895 [Peptococcaceae bacterium SCADC1_2_3]KFI36399.1 hypothetical protein HY00_00545 [Peptococcaceae bacterium SCADC1_2_3]
MADASTNDAEMQELMKLMHGELVLEPSEEVLAISLCRYGNANRDWNSLLLLTGKRVVTRPRRDYDAKRWAKGFRDTVVSDDCYREVPLSQIVWISTKRWFEQRGPELAIVLTSGKEFKLGEVWLSGMTDLIAKLAGLDRKTRSIGSIVWKMVMPFSGLTLFCLVSSFLMMSVGVILTVLGVANIIGVVHGLFLPTLNAFLLLMLPDHL